MSRQVLWIIFIGIYGLALVIDGWRRMRTPGRRGFSESSPRTEILLGIGMVCLGLVQFANVVASDTLSWIAGIGVVGSLIAAVVLGLRARRRMSR